jgi:hypothetical protein
MRAAFSLKYSLSLAFALGACLAVSCQDSGATSVCPPLPQYQTYPLGDASIMDAAAGAQDIDAAFARAVDAGCATAPSFFPSDGGEGGMGGATPIQDAPGAGGSSAGATGHG